MSKRLLLGVVLLLGFPLASAAAISGDCSGCHTMHNSEQNAPVVKTGLGGVTTSAVPIKNLLKYDCVACHAQNTTKIVPLEGSLVPQVYHSDGTGDLAAGNFRYITEGGSRKGHDVVDFFPDGDSDMYNEFLNRIRPPGHHGGLPHTVTCAGTAGCHGTRVASSSNPVSGMPAISGAHHRSYDGQKNPAMVTTRAHSGVRVADGYRFIPGLKGYGNETNRWQNVDADSHNEYYGDPTTISYFSDIGGPNACVSCHVESIGVRVPNQSMSGFCVTCHGLFHSSGTENGVSGAFLRHPSDYVIPNRPEYAAYTSYEVTAPVARPTLYSAASSVVTPGTDMVMCLSCHQAHASPYDGMLRFDYADMVAGNTSDRVGCLACHTTK